MAEERTYLELSEEGGSSHKFYEVVVDGAKLTIRYGRIGDAGQVQTKDFPTPEKATAEAQKKINEKKKKGYEPAVQGVRQKRTVTRRSAMLDLPPAPAAQPARSQSSRSSSSSRSSAPARPVPPPPPRQTAPVLWKFNTEACAFGIFVDSNYCWVGNEAGKIFALNHEGEVHRKFKLPDGVKCIVSDGDWLYGGCDDGKVYDLSGKSPTLAYEISDDVDIFWLDICDGVLAVSDSAGNVTVINHEDESQWSKKSGGSAGWMVRCDEIGVYHGHGQGVTMYDWEDGKVIWTRLTPGAVLFGWQEEADVYACTSYGHIHKFAKNGEEGPKYRCNGAVYSCATSGDGRYVFGADKASDIYCFDGEGKLLWQLPTGCGVALSMQYFQERLYIGTHHGFLACIDTSEAAIQAAQTGTVPKAVSLTAPQVEAFVPATVETTTDASQGVTVECYREGSGLRVRVISEGYNRDWHCQFPKDIREAGARYVVDEVREAKQGGFYRVFGTIRKLTQ